MLETLSINDWHAQGADHIHQQTINKLEQGNVLYFPKLAFNLLPHEIDLLSADYTDSRSKNISYYRQRLSGTKHLTSAQHQHLSSLLARFSQCAYQFIQTILPHYSQQLIVARTSFRPVEIYDRKSSYRKDDKRLHVDAFPSSPNQGKRILRVFCNINPDGLDRVWRIGEPFETVAKQFLPALKKPFPGSALMLQLFKITKSYRTLYDHYMLQLHDFMKQDSAYQKNATQQECRFAANTTWVVQTDHVSHAAMSGKHVLEQTFYLPVTAMLNESLSPLRILERLLQKRLT
jgi:hypothetical protein